MSSSIRFYRGDTLDQVFNLSFADAEAAPVGSVFTFTYQTSSGETVISTATPGSGFTFDGVSQLTLSLGSAATQNIPTNPYGTYYLIKWLLGQKIQTIVAGRLYAHAGS